LLLLLLAWPALGQSPPAASKEDALLAAIRRSDAAAVKQLIADGANVNHKFRYDRMPLSFAADRGHLDIVKMLLEAGADVNARDSFYNATALDWALEKSHVEIVRLLLEKGAGGREQALVTAARRGRLELVKMLLALGGLKDESLSNALDAAERAKRVEVAAALREAGAKPLPRPDFPVDAQTLARYAGAFRSETPGAPELSFTVKDGKLTGGVPGQQPITLGAFDAVTFTALETSGIRITFKVEDGRCTGLHLKQGGFEAHYKRVEDKKP
jgi:ankyrin repeat protein